MKTAVIVTTFNRPAALARSLPQIVAAAKEVGAPVLVVDDGSTEVGVRGECGCDEQINWDCGKYPSVTLLRLPENRGLAGALNIGLSYFLADPSIEVIHYVQDDVEVDLLAFAACNVVIEKEWNATSGGIRGVYAVTGHDAKEHRERDDAEGPEYAGIKTRRRTSCRATHIAGSRSAWLRVMPIPSRGLGLPGTRIMDGKRGTGSGVDWWVVRDSPNRLPVLCIPGLVRSFANKAADSTWLNESIGGEEPPLSRDAIKGWLENRK